jgi:pimeloyl-ACP methyl ester carboxylesterase
MPDPSSLYKSPQGYRAMMAWYDAELARLPVAADTFFVDTRFGATHVVAAGPRDAPPLVLLQGLGGNAMMWRPQLIDLSRSYRVMALDVIGQTGRSAPSRPPHTGPAYAHWLTDVFDALSLDRAALVGLSYGGRLALQFGAYAPERITKTILISPIGFKTLNFGLFLRLLPIGFNLHTPSREATITLLRGILAPTADPQQNADLAALIERFYLFVAYYRQEQWSALPLPFPLPRALLHRHTSPTLLLVGEHEVLFNPHAVVARARRVLPNLTAAAIIPGAGHVVHYERPDVVNTHILEFLSKETGGQ